MTTAVADDFAPKYGPWALVTGAAQGLGAAFAETLGSIGLALVLVDRQEEQLAATAERLRRTHGVEVIEVVVDLTDPDSVSGITRATENLDVGLLIANAALGNVGPFLDADIEDLLSTVDVNVRAALVLTHTYGRDMARRGRGGIILLASNAGYQGTPFVANYAATKAYNLVLGEGLWYELREHGVDVLAFAPGATNTPSLRSVRPGLTEGVKARGVMLPDDSVRAALAALGRSPSARPGWAATLETFVATRLVGRRRAVTTAGAYMNRQFRNGGS